MTKPRRKKRDREASCRSLLEAAVAVFAERGYDAATTREIARKAGVSEGLIHRYFRSKSGLLLAILRDFSDENSQCPEKALPPAKSLLEEFRQVLECACARQRDRSDFLRVVLSRALVDPKIAGQLGTNMRNRHRVLHEARLKWYRQEGFIREGADLEATAFILASLGWSLGFLWPEIFGFNRKRMDTMAERAARLLVDALGS